MRVLFRYIKTMAPYLLAAWVIIILVFSSLPRLPQINIHNGLLERYFDKLMHFSEYFALAFLAFLTFAKSEISLWSKKVSTLMIFLIVFAAADETHQLIIVARSFSIYDMIADFLGIIFGTLFTLLLNRLLD